MIPEEMDEILKIIEKNLVEFSYFISEDCKFAMAQEIYDEFKEDFELAWQYRGLE